MATNANPDPVQQPGVQATQAPASLLEEIVKEGRLGQTPEEQGHGKDWLRSLVEQVTKGQITVSQDMEKTINDRIRQLDEVISLQLNEILHDPEFQRLEAGWRGLHYLV